MTQNSVVMDQELPQQDVAIPAAAAAPAVQPPSRFTFDGGAATYVGTALLGIVLTVFTLGIMYPFALVLRERWRAKHSYIDGRQLEFRGSAIGLFGRWLLWLGLMIITLGIYAFWVGPRLQRWKWEHTAFAV